MSNIDIVRDMFDSCITQDGPRAERLLDADFVFTSPRDDHIDRAAYFERCFPTSERLERQDVRCVVAAGGEDVFGMYGYVLKMGAHHRNVELLTVRDGQIVETQVFFSGPVHDD